ncbi:unnamed protein product, partial [Effrenium voratum]
ELEHRARRKPQKLMTTAAAGGAALLEELKKQGVLEDDKDKDEEVARARAFTVTGGKMTLKDELAGRVAIMAARQHHSRRLFAVALAITEKALRDSAAARRAAEACGLSAAQGWPRTALESKLSVLNFENAGGDLLLVVLKQQGWQLCNGRGSFAEMPDL